MLHLTQRDFDILESLTRRVRLLAIDQLRQIWWPSGQSNRIVRRRMLLLVAAGLIERSIVNAHPLLPIADPLGRWCPGSPQPDAFRVSHSARLRWNQPAEPTEVFTASRRTANLFGKFRRTASKVVTPRSRSAAFTGLSPLSHSLSGGRYPLVG